jgi:hypothetical protein
MSDKQGGPRPADDISEIELAWVAANMGRMRGWVVGPRFLYVSLVIALLLGLMAHISGYLLAASATGEPIALIADLIANLGIALWTGGVLVVFVQILPEARRRSAARYLARYEAALRERGSRRGDQQPSDDRST